MLSKKFNKFFLRKWGWENCILFHYLWPERGRVYQQRGDDNHAQVLPHHRQGDRGGWRGRSEGRIILKHNLGVKMLRPSFKLIDSLLRETWKWGLFSLKYIVIPKLELRCQHIHLKIFMIIRILLTWQWGRWMLTKMEKEDNRDAEPKTKIAK